MARNLRSTLKREELRKLYVQERKSLEDIARMFGVSRVAVWKYCKAEKLTRRSRSEARLEAQKQSKVPQKYYHINDNFFSLWSREMAYILGLLVTDGCVSNTACGSYRISLCLNDKELLDKVAKALDSGHKIVESRHQRGLKIFIFGRNKIAQDLLKLGMKPRKSLDLEFPDVPNEYLRDFIRGVFDGDGSVYFSAKGVKWALVTKFVGGSRLFIYELERKLRDLGMPKRTIYEEKRKNISYSFKYGHGDSVKLQELMYNNAAGQLYLERKFDRFMKGVKYGKAG